MKKKKVWRYYCEYCKKSGCSGGHLKRHEDSCTNNPNRICKMCNCAEFAQQPIKDLITALGDGDKTGVDKLRELSEGCPACMLSAIRQSKLQYYEIDEDGEHFFSVDFDFKVEKSAFWSEIEKEKYTRVSDY